MRCRLSFVLVALSIIACGGVAPVQGPSDAEPMHFVCELDPAEFPTTFIECATLPDGGPSYFGPDDVDCRERLADSGHGCVPQMACHAFIDGGIAGGACVEHP